MSPKTRHWMLVLFLLFSTVWLWKFVSESDMRRLDKEVDRLCAVDGRIVVYETIKLPADKFTDGGRSLVPFGKDEIGFGYYYKSTTTALAGPGQAPGARLLRMHYQVLRSNDSKVMAEAIIYTRGGGYWLEGFPGIGHGKNCPGVIPLNFKEQVFIKD